LDAKTRASLRYATKLTEAPSMVGADDIAKLRDAGWDEREIWEITALTSFFNFSGRLEAASGLPPDEIPEGARLAEAGGARSPDSVTT
jgi:alkylhydroperoxidase family enzyme